MSYTFKSVGSRNVKLPKSLRRTCPAEIDAETRVLGFRGHVANRFYKGGSLTLQFNLRLTWRTKCPSFRGSGKIL